MSGGIARGRLAEVSQLLAFWHCSQCPSFAAFGIAEAIKILVEGFCAEPASCVMCVLRVGSSLFPMPWARGKAPHVLRWQTLGIFCFGCSLRAKEDRRYLDVSCAGRRLRAALDLSAGSSGACFTPDNGGSNGRICTCEDPVDSTNPKSRKERMSALWSISCDMHMSAGGQMPMHFI